VYNLDVASLTRAADTQRTRRRLRVAPTVWLLGFVSLLTDVSSEMVASILPVYLFIHLQLSPLEFGLVDGLYQGVTAIARLASGVIADRWRRLKAVAVVGYTLSAACKIGLLAAGAGWGLFATIISIDRVGKGIRTSPRDALISLSSRQEDLASAFGVHRALDTAGVVIGPFIAFVALSLVPGGFDVVFVLSFVAAFIGLALLVLLVQDARAGSAAQPAISLLRAVLLVTDRRLRRIAALGALLSFTVMSDAFLYLILQQRSGSAPERIPLLYVGTACAYLILAVPAGLLADRVGRTRVYLAGHLGVLAVYAIAASVTLNGAWILVCLLFHGAYYAATEGVLAAIASAIVPPGVRASGLAALATATSLARLAGSVFVGLLWTWHGPAGAIWFALASTVIAVSVSALMLRAMEPAAQPGS
jgi:MFS family permease